MSTERRAVEALLRSVHDHPWIVASLVGGAATFAYGLTLRYYDSAYAAAGWPRLSLPVDQKSALARALVAVLLVAAIAPLAHMLYFVTKDHKTT